MKIVPVTLADAKRFIAEHHRHNKPPVGHKFSVGLRADNDELIGVATAGRPVARHFDDGKTLEVNRSCTDGTKNANSMLYGAIRKIAFGMGYERVITYTQADESGASLRAAGFAKVKELPIRGNWAEHSIARRSGRDPEGPKAPRILWEIRRASAIRSGGSHDRA